MPPFIIPDVPEPATARPMMNIFDETDTAHSKDPNSNIAKNERKVYC